MEKPVLNRDAVIDELLADGGTNLVVDTGPGIYQRLGNYEQRKHEQAQKYRVFRRRRSTLRSKEIDSSLP